ncbi:MAG: phosphoribosylanthranilate isomerase [Actinomycetota bacterium]|nr:phosphoribosylanthranilate isomerase [Actinomycetota bacterium]
MRRTRVKICGLTSAADAAGAVRAGADAVGVLLAESPRQVSVSEAEEILAAVPPFVARVGVFVDAPADYVEAAVRRLGLHAVQFHGDESPEQCAAAPAPVIKVLKVGTGFDSSVVEPYRGSVAAVLLDTYELAKSGGTGKTFCWQGITSLPGWAPFVLAGGLTPGNVGEAIATLCPYAVDVSSGVEERPRAKDRLLMQAFVAAVRAADAEVRR